MSSPQQSTTVNDLLGKVTALWPDASWGWDDRFHCALSTVSKAQEGRAREALLAGMPMFFTKDTLIDAPEGVRQVCARTGGLLGGQAAYFGQLPDGALVYCLWWPWGGGANFSARIGAVGTKDLITQVRTTLGIR